MTDEMNRLIDVVQRLTIEVQLFREAFVANNLSICESCSHNPCNKKVMLGDRKVFECTMYKRIAEQTEPKSNANQHVQHVESVEPTQTERGESGERSKSRL